MLYFAYGSNMDFARMRKRCPGAQFLCKVLLPEHELQFTRWSESLQSGVADILTVPGKAVWGVVYHLEPTDRRRLDEFEGVKEGAEGAYRPENLLVQIDGGSTRSLRVFTYVVCIKASARPKPSKRYLQYLLDGATHWGLPPDYIEQLRRIRTHDGDGKE